jgi:hypothetical protein
VRIFVEITLSDPSDQLDEIVRQAVAILRDSRIQSAREGGAINGHAVVLVDAAELPEACASWQRRACGRRLIRERLNG